MAKWTPAEMVAAALGTAAVGFGAAVLIRKFLPGVPMPLWLPGGPPVEEASEPAALPFTFGGNMPNQIGYKNGRSFPIELVPIGANQWLAADAAAAFVSMREAARIEGVTLLVNTSFRDMAFQRALYAKYQAGTGNLAAKPGYSNHQAGTAVDISTENGTNDAFRWLTDHASRFGFKRTVRSEPWHWEWFAANVA